VIAKRESLAQNIDISLSQRESMGVRIRLYILKGIGIIAAIATVWGTYEPWLIFTGEAHNVLIGTFELSGYTGAFGFGSLNTSSASVSVWSSHFFSSASTDFWFGLIPLVGGVLNFLLFWKLENTKHYRTTNMIAVMTCIATIFGCLWAVIYYTPYVFVVVGQIDSLMTGGVFLYAENTTVIAGPGPFVSLIASTISSTVYLVLQWKKAEVRASYGGEDGLATSASITE
jgi:hypothetical protein